MAGKQQRVRFTGVVARFPDGFRYYYVVFPYDAVEVFGTKDRVRVTGNLNGIPIDRGLIPDGNGGHYIILGGDLRKQAGLRLGSAACFELQLHESPDEPQVPEELAMAFELEPEAGERFRQLTPGLRRSLIYYITSAKRTETREQRAGLMLQRIMSGYFKTAKTDRSGES